MTAARKAPTAKAGKRSRYTPPPAPNPANAAARAAGAQQFTTARPLPGHFRTYAGLDGRLHTEVVPVWYDPTRRQLIHLTAKEPRA